MIHFEIYDRRVDSTQGRITKIKYRSDFNLVRAKARCASASVIAMELSSLLLVLTAISCFLYWYLTRTFDYWKNQNVPSLPKPLPGFGHMLPIIRLKQGFPQFHRKLYRSTEASMFGFFFMRTPALLIREPELVKYVLQSNFSHFCNNPSYIQPKKEPVMAKNPFFTTDPHLWKQRKGHMLSLLSGKKLRLMFPIFQAVCLKMCSFNDRKIAEGGGCFEEELKGYFVRYTGEIVANAAFAIEGQSYEDDPDRLSFAVLAKTIFDSSFVNKVKQILLFYLPVLADLVDVRILSRRSEEFFRQNIELILKRRRDSTETPNDFLQFSIESNDIDDVESIVADVVAFYLDVYETSSSSLAGIVYYLSQHEDVQRKLRDHVTAAIGSDVAVTYDSLKSTSYLDQVIQESLRLLPPVPTLRKLCTRESSLEGSDGLTCRLKPGDRVHLSILDLHLDEKYWEDPELFDPDRFSPENVKNRRKSVFLPFGEGPRMCPGQNLGFVIMKLAVAELITRYSIEPSERMKTPLELEPTQLTCVKGGLWAKFKKLK